MIVKRYRYDPSTGRVRPSDEVQRRRMASMEIIPDIKPHQSPIDDSWITSRSDMREHNARHNVEQVGNDYSPRPKHPFHSRADEVVERVAERWAETGSWNPRP